MARASSYCDFSMGYFLKKTTNYLNKASYREADANISFNPKASNFGLCAKTIHLVNQSLPFRASFWETFWYGLTRDTSHGASSIFSGAERIK